MSGFFSFMPTTLRAFIVALKQRLRISPDFKSLIARLLCRAVETRLRRNLSFGYRRREDTLKRVRGRIDILVTESRDLFRRGEIACRFEELTINTPRNRLVRAALTVLGGWIDNYKDKALAHRTRTLATTLGRAGVNGLIPSRAEIASDQIARHESEDRLMVSLARAVFDLFLPTEQVGARTIFEAQRDGMDFRKLFEKAIGNFFDAELPREEGWHVYSGKQIYWPSGAASAGIQMYLPIMKTDIILDNEQGNRRIIIDTKFTDILTKARGGGDGLRFKSEHIFQIYSYLRSQERLDDPRSLTAEGMLLYPAIGINIDEMVDLQGHIVRFATINLNEPTNVVVENLRRLPVQSTLNHLRTSEEAIALKGMG